MDCEMYIELMSAALDGELSAEERRQLDSHLAVCPQCAHLYEQLCRNAQAARELDCVVPADLKARIMENLPAQESVKQGKVIRWKRWIPVAAAACLVLVVSLLPHGGMKAADAPRAAETSVADYAEAPRPDNAAKNNSAYGVYDDVTGEVLPQEPAAMAPGASGELEMGGFTSEGVPDSEPNLYRFENQQIIRVHYGATPDPGAVVIGSADSLKAYLASFGSLAFDGENNSVPIAALEALCETYTEEFFRTRRLLCVVVESGSGSNRYEIAPQGLTRDTVAVKVTVPEIGTCDMAAWLLVAEVDAMFDDGDVLEVKVSR